MRKKNKKKSFLSSFFMQILAVFVIIAVFSLGSALSREFYREYQIKKEIEGLQNEIAEMEENNYELSQLLEYYKTEEYKEAEARQRLNLKKEGEKVVMIEDDGEIFENDILENKESQEKISNYLKWWNYFFAS